MIKKDTSFLPHCLCTHCGELIAYRDAYKVSKFFGAEEKELCFCNEAHAKAYYLNWLQKETSHEVLTFRPVLVCCNPRAR